MIMNKGITLIELLLSIALASVIFMILYGMNRTASRTYMEIRDNWYCMQSIRNAILVIRNDMSNCGYLMPQDIRIAVRKNQLFIAGLPKTSSHSGLKIPSDSPPPCYSIIRILTNKGIELDTIDLDNDNRPDYWADLGLITNSGTAVISHSYKKGAKTLPLARQDSLSQWDRAIPAIHYELKSNGLYRNSQFLAEAITGFDAKLSAQKLSIEIKAGRNDTQKHVSLSYPFE